ncbi:MAG: hypothetical protein LBQ37_01540 [Elusimicrobiota bacterium]|jgi:hypothetical protein|nr:hypothetical protein [Elusimicrobiota bacterium]
MKNDKRFNFYKYLFLISTLSGVLGAFSLYKDFKTAGWVLISIWLVLAILVRVLIIKNRRGGKNGFYENGQRSDGDEKQNRRDE